MKFKIEDGKMKTISEDKVPTTEVKEQPTETKNPFNEIMEQTTEKAVQELKSEQVPEQQAVTPQQIQEYNQQIMAQQMQAQMQQAQMQQAQMQQAQLQQQLKLQQEAQLREYARQQLMSQMQPPHIPPMQVLPQNPPMPVTNQPTNVSIILTEQAKFDITLMPNEVEQFMSDLDASIQDGATFRVGETVLNTKHIIYYTISQ